MLNLVDFSRYSCFKVQKTGQLGVVNWLFHKQIDFSPFNSNKTVIYLRNL